jgi:hypothetical protein
MTMLASQLSSGLEICQTNLIQQTSRSIRSGRKTGLKPSSRMLL